MRSGEFAPVNSSVMMGANGGPCNGHLLSSQMRLLSADVGQTNWSSWISHTGAKSPDGKNCKIGSFKNPKGRIFQLEGVEPPLPSLVPSFVTLL